MKIWESAFLTHFSLITLLIFFAVFNCSATTMSITFPPQLQRAIWIGDSTAIIRLDRSQPMVSAFLANEASGHLAKLKTYDNCDFENKQYPAAKRVVCRLLLASSYFAQGDIPDLAKEEIDGGKALKEYEKESGHSDLQVPQYEILTNPAAAQALPRPQYRMSPGVYKINWSKACPQQKQVIISLNGHSVCFTLDLGTTRSTISYGSARQASLSILRSSEISGQYRGAHSTTVHVAAAAALKIGGVTAKNIYFAVTSPSNSSTSYNLLGLDFLMHLGDISFEKGGIVTNAHPLGHESCAPLTYGLTSGFTLRGILLPAIVNGDSVYLQVDSGSNLGLFLYDGAIVANLTPLGTITGWANNNAGLTRKGWAYKVSTSFLGETKLETYAGLSLWGDPEHFKGPLVGSIGLPILQKAHFQVDFVRHKVCTSIQRQSRPDSP